MGGLRRRLDKLEDEARPEPEGEHARVEEHERTRESAEHANRCGWGKEFGRWPLFEIAENGEVFCTHDGKPVTDSGQTLAEHFYWMEFEWGGGSLIHDEEAEAFYTPEGELAVSRDRVNLQCLLNR